VAGSEGNIEFLAHLAESPGMAPEALEERIRVLTAPLG
jgi:hypothetical protein